MKILSQNLAHGMAAALPAAMRAQKIAESLEALSAFLIATPIDVVCLQELAADARLSLASHPHVHRVTAHGMDVAIASTTPLERPSGAPFHRSGVGKGVAWANVMSKDAAIRVGSMHLAVLSPFARKRQLAQAVALAHVAGPQGDEPLFLVGDTNEPRARVFDAWSQAHGMTASEPGASFPRAAPVLRLDRALVTRGVMVVERGVVDTRFSDHRGVTFEVAT